MKKIKTFFNYKNINLSIHLNIKTSNGKKLKADKEELKPTILEFIRNKVLQKKNISISYISKKSFPT